VCVCMCVCVCEYACVSMRVTYLCRPAACSSHCAHVQDFVGLCFVSVAELYVFLEYDLPL